MKELLESLFAADGALAQSIPGFQPRPAQLRMAQAVADTLAEIRTLVVEAGTGTGKTYAYLAPALLSGRRTVISTGTLNLQDQLFSRDLPRLREALATAGRVSLLKGRANYLCWHRLLQAQSQPAMARESGRLQIIHDWARRSESGEIAQSGLVRRDDPLMPRVTSTAENCLGSKCSEFERCFVARARQAAQAADLVVVNHHLLLSDFMLKEEGFGQILPGAETVIVDEAHQLPEVAERFFGRRVSTQQLADLAHDSAQQGDLFGDMPDLRKSAAVLMEWAGRSNTLFGSFTGRLRLDDFLKLKDAADVVSETTSALAGLQQVLQAFAERGPDLEALAHRATDCAQRLESVSAEDEDSEIHWVESHSHGGSLHATPLRFDNDFRRLREATPGAWVFTSATLAVGEDFSHYVTELGLENAEVLRLDSPFDFETQARLYLPSGLPEPNTPGYHDRLLDAVLPLIRESGGGAFLLCTSHRALKLAAARLKKELKLPLFVQGEGDRAALLDEFSRAGNGVLVGTSSFWEGVDVRGQALRLVIIDRLPFTAPGDPVYEARLRAIEKSGGRPFMDYQLPQAIMSLRQGAGRLIRDVNDHGLLVLCDPRLRSKSYGRLVLASLPEMPVLDELTDALNWVRRCASGALLPAASNAQPGMAGPEIVGDTTASPGTAKRKSKNPYKAN